MSVGVPQFPSFPILPSQLSDTLYVEQVPNTVSQPAPLLKQLLIQPWHYFNVVYVVGASLQVCSEQAPDDPEGVHLHLKG